LAGPRGYRPFSFWDRIRRTEVTSGNLDTTSIRERTFHYNFYCLAFLDILGQRRKLRQLPRIPNKDQETEDLLKETAGYVLKLRHRLEDTFNEFQKATSFSAALPENLRKRLIDARGSVKYRGFSDSFIIAVSLRGDDDQCSPIIGIYGCMAACCILHLAALAYKRPIRGAIDVGLGLDITDDEVYGPVLEQAHFLESQVADYPRIIVGDELLRCLDTVNKQTPNSIFGRLAKDIASRCIELIVLDNDGFPVLDFLGEAMAKTTPAAERQNLFKPATEYIEEQKQIARSERNYQHLSRYNRLGTYFEEHADLWK